MDLVLKILVPLLVIYFFANDDLLFLRANKVESRVMLSILNNYCKTLGQVINHDKSSVLFGKGVLEALKCHLEGILGCIDTMNRRNILGCHIYKVVQKWKLWGLSEKRLCPSYKVGTKTYSQKQARRC